MLELSVGKREPRGNLRGFTAYCRLVRHFEFHSGSRDATRRNRQGVDMNGKRSALEVATEKKINGEVD